MSNSCQLQNHYHLPFDYCIQKNIQSINQELQILGQGGFGRVMKGYNHNLETDVALKLFKGNHKYKHYTNQDKVSSKFDHVNFVKYYEGFNFNGQWYLSMEYCGQSLDKKIEKDKQFITQEQVYKIARTLITALQFAHRKGYLHLDIKLGNIMINKKKQIKIGDLGIMSKAQQSMKNIPGTIKYHPPEAGQIKEKGRLNLTCFDVWAVGLTLFYCLKQDYKEEFIIKHFAKPNQRQDRYWQIQSFWSAIKMGYEFDLSQFHPFFDFLIHWMIEYNADKRPQFHELFLLKDNQKIKQSVKQKSKNSSYNMINDLIPKEKQIIKHICYQYQKYNIIIKLLKQLKQNFIDCQKNQINLIIYYLLYMFKERTKIFLYGRLKAYQFRLPNPNNNNPSISLIPSTKQYTLQYFKNTKNNGSLLRLYIELYTKKLSRKCNAINIYLQQYYKKVNNSQQKSDLIEIIKLSPFTYEQCRKSYIDLLKKDFIQNRLKITNFLNTKILYIYLLMFLVCELDSYFPSQNYKIINIQNELIKYKELSYEILIQKIRQLNIKLFKKNN